MAEPKTQGTMLSPLRPGQVFEPVVTAVDVNKVYGRGASAVSALRGVSVELGRGQLTAIMGPSGSGKTSLLRCLAGLEQVTSGLVRLNEIDLTGLNKRQLAQLRRQRIGFIFRSFNLVPTLTVRENITLPLDIARQRIDQGRLDDVVRAMGLSDRLDSRASTLSSSQEQRTACARALIADPFAVFADEPTGNLDTRSAFQLLQVLRRMVDEFGQTVVVATHGVETAIRADRVIFMADGVITGEILNPTRDSVLEALREVGEQDDLEQAPVNWISPVAEVPLPADTDEEAPLEEEPEDSSPVLPAEDDDATEEFTVTLIPIPEPEPEPEPEFIEEFTLQPLSEPEPEETSEPTALALEEALDQIAPAPHLPDETVKVIDLAQQILSDLPGSVVDDYTRDDES